MRYIEIYSFDHERNLRESLIHFVMAGDDLESLESFEMT